ncbi:MAG: TIGR04255 family protein [Candidatus Thorarchaeota archaeon]
MKEIISYDAKSLETFIISLSYQTDILGIETDKITPLSNEIGKYYPIKPRLGLLKRRFTEVQLGHLRFYDEDKKNFVDVGQDFLVFVFNKYTRWPKELNKTINVFKSLQNYVEIPKIVKIVLTYIDVFKIPKEVFKFNDYFTFPIFNNGPDFFSDIKFYDINIGFVPFDSKGENERKKIVIRIKSRPQESDKYIFGLETVGSVDDLIMPSDASILKEYLDDCHDRIIDTFLTILTDQYKEELDLIYE